MIGEAKLLEQPKSRSSSAQLLTMDQRNSCKDIFISISGLIGEAQMECPDVWRCEQGRLFLLLLCSVGAGKSTLATELAKLMDLPCYYEPVKDNEYLGDFYKNPARYSFPLQVNYLLKFGILQNARPLICLVLIDCGFLTLFPPDISVEPTLSAASRDHLVRSWRCARPYDIRRLGLREGKSEYSYSLQPRMDSFFVRLDDMLRGFFVCMLEATYRVE